MISRTMWLLSTFPGFSRIVPDFLFVAMELDLPAYMSKRNAEEEPAGGSASKQSKSSVLGKSPAMAGPPRRLGRGAASGSASSGGGGYEDVLLALCELGLEDEADIREIAGYSQWTILVPCGTMILLRCDRLWNLLRQQPWTP